MYGPMETGVNISYCCVQPEPVVNIIGKPLRNVKFYIPNDWLQVVPLGNIGRLAAAVYIASERLYQ
jgi:non-ribosomal peptide synthetase component F